MSHLEMEPMQSLSEIIERNKPTVVVLHSPRVSSIETKRKSRVLPKGCDIRDPRNFLMSGGGRVLEQEREKQQAQLAKEKVKELKTASTALADELLRTRQKSERDITKLRDEMLELLTKFKTEQERIALLKQRLAEEDRVRAEIEEAHQSRVKDLHKRLQAEHILRVNAETELAKAQDTSSTVSARVKGFEDELAGALQEVASLQDAKLDLEMALNKERKQHMEAQTQLESLRLVQEREKTGREKLHRKTAELEGTVAGLSERNGGLFMELKKCEASLQAANEAKCSADKALLHNKEELRIMSQQLESQRKTRAAALEEAKVSQQQLEELEARMALYIAKEAHYDDLKSEYEAACKQLEDVRASLAHAKGDVLALTTKLDAAVEREDRLGFRVQQQSAQVEALQQEVLSLQQQVTAKEEAVEEAHAAGKLLMSTIKDKDCQMAGYQVQVEELQGAREALCKSRDDLAKLAQEKDAQLEGLRQDLCAVQDEFAAAHRRHKQLQAEADASELELSRRDLKTKELSDTVRTLLDRLEGEQANAAAEKRRIEGVIRSLETRMSQSQSELGSAKQELAALQQARLIAQAELAAAQEECTLLRSQLQEEQARGSRLRGEVAALSSSYMREVESKGQVVAEVTARLQVEEGGRVAAEQEARALKRRVEELESELSEVQNAHAHAQEASESSQAALESMRRKLQVYKQENRNLMSSYDDWLKTMVKTRPSAALQ